MGVCALKRMWAEDREQEKVSELVRYAVTSDLVQLREMIAKRKINPNAKDRFGMNAIHWASYVGELACVQELIKAGGSPFVRDLNGRNALHHACRKDHDKVVRYLITAAKVDVNSRSENQDTPLHKAVRGKSIRSTEVLLQLGADPNLRNEQNRTPMEELELTMQSMTSESNHSNQVKPVKQSTSSKVYREPFDERSGPPESIGLALKPITDGRIGLSVEYTDVKSYGDSRNVTECSDHTARRVSTSHEPGQWATPTFVSVQNAPPRLRKNLRYVGKRVIMALRVKKALSSTEKLELIRLILQKYTDTTPLT